MRRLLAALLLLPLAACTAVEVDDDDTASTAEELLGTTTYHWDQYLGHELRMIPYSDGFCFLTKLTGHFVGRGEQVYIRSHDGYLWLGGTSYQDGVGAEARCTLYSDFETTHHYDTTQSTGATASSPGQVTLGAFDMACYLTQIQGQLNGGGEAAAIETDRYWQKWNLNVKSGIPAYDNGLFAAASCVDFRQVGEVKYWGGEAGYFGEYRWAQGQPRVRMAPIGAADCFLTRITGRFRGGGESVEIANGGDGWWYLQGTSYQVDVGASARCVDRVQPVEALVRDGGFENQATGTIAWPWGTEGGGPKGIDRGLGNQYNGNNNGWIRATTGWNALTNVVAVQANRTYRVTAKVRAASVSAGYFGARDPNGGILAETSFGSASGGYQTLTFNVYSGGNTWLRVYVGYWGPGSDSWIQIDDVSMVQTP